MNSKTVKLRGRDLLWYELREASSSSKPATWKRHLLAVLALVGLKLAHLASSDGVEFLVTWLADSRGLVGWP